MQTFTGTEYLKIDIANCFGLDRLTWNNRLHWVNNNYPDLPELSDNAKNPILFRKAVRALRLTEKGEPTNHIMGLDATASGLQIMAALSGCHVTASAVNLINTGKRECVYQTVADHMSTFDGISVDRDITKKPVMTAFYGSTAQPKEVFGEGTALLAFHETLAEKLKGAYALMQIFQKYWNPYAEYHSWALPDGHIAKVPVTEVEEKSLEVDEFNHMRFAYRTTVIKPKTFSRSLTANIVHSIDGWIVREMVKLAEHQGFWLAPIHDCFYASPNNMDKVRKNYIVILQWIANSSLVNSILKDITGHSILYRKLSNNLADKIEHSEYTLS
jgi:DNA-directed RNA polymerase